MHYIGVDRGAVLLQQRGIAMEYAIGDFDSITQQELALLEASTKIQQLPVRKNESDSEFAIKFASERYDEVFITGVIGGRVDHFLALYHMLAFGNYTFTILDEQNCLYRLQQGTHTIRKSKQYISLFACQPTVLSIQGVEYPLHEVTLDVFDVYTLSNEIVETEAVLEIISGAVVVTQSDDTAVVT